MDDWLNYRYRSTETHGSSSTSYCLSPRRGQSAPHVLACSASVQVRTLECCRRSAGGGEF